MIEEEIPMCAVTAVDGCDSGWWLIVLNSSISDTISRIKILIKTERNCPKFSQWSYNCYSAKDIRTMSFLHHLTASCQLFINLDSLIHSSLISSAAFFLTNNVSKTRMKDIPCRDERFWWTKNLHFSHQLAFKQIVKKLWPISNA